MERVEVKTKHSGMHRRIILEQNRVYRVVSLNSRRTKHCDRECVLLDLVPVSEARSAEQVAKVRFLDNNRTGRIDPGDLLPVGALVEGEYTEDDPTHRPEDYGWDGLDIPDDMLKDMVFRAEHGMRLTKEQRQALARNYPNSWVYQQDGGFIPVPSNPKKITREQTEAMFGGKERSELASRWFQLELMMLNIQQRIDAGETEHVNEDGSRVSLQSLLYHVKPSRDHANAELAAYDNKHRWDVEEIDE